MIGRDTLILFLKVPRLGRVKTRLAATLGAAAARGVYRHLAATAIARLGLPAHSWRTVLAVTPRRHRWREWRRPALPQIDQGDRDLGRRMARCLREQARPRALLVGGDIPDLTPAAIRRGFEALGTNDFVFGPAVDGGYWAIGWHRRRSWPRGALERVRWSSPAALADSVTSLGARRVGLIDRLADLDDGADYRQWKLSR